MKLKKWIEQWLENYVKPTVKIRTYERYKELTTHIICSLGEYDIKKLSPGIIQNFILDLLNYGNLKTGNGLATNTVNLIISLLQSSIKMAVLVGIMDSFNLDAIKRPKYEEKIIECFTLQEQKKIEKAVISSKKEKLFGIIVCLYTGLRIGELLALVNSDIDLEKRTISVTKSCHYGHDSKGNYIRIVDSPKTASSIRVIPISKQLIPLIKDHNKVNNSSYFISNKGNPISTRSYQRSFESLLKKLNIYHRGFHALRHTFATRAIESGMDVKTLSEILGHKNSTITLNRYTHSLTEHKYEMMNRLGKLL